MFKDFAIFNVLENCKVFERKVGGLYMKKSIDMLGLPIISINEGRELGVSKSLVIDAEQGIVAALVIEDEDWYRGVKVMPFKAVSAIGEDAIIINNSSDILQLNDASEFEPLLVANIKIIGTKVITKSGSIHGKITELIIDEAGAISKCLIETSSGASSEITAEQVSTFGKQVTIINSDGGNSIINETKAAMAVETVITEPIIEEPTPVVAEVIVPEVEEVVETVIEETIEEEEVQAEEKPVDDRHRKFLLGKKAGRTITTDSGVVIVEQGADITEEVLQKAKLAGKFVDLSMNIQ